MSGFEGLTEETYRFFWEIAFNNNIGFFEENRSRFKKTVQQPLLALAQELAPLMAQIDPEFNLRPSSVVSRIRRDTRYTRDKSPYRDHMWLVFKRHGESTGECFGIYVEFTREAYSYGMGMYAPMPGLMNDIRGRILARPTRFLQLVKHPEFQARFVLVGEDYKRLKLPDAPPELQLWLNKRSLSYSHTSAVLQPTLSHRVAEELISGYTLLKPVYRFMMGLE